MAKRPTTQETITEAASAVMPAVMAMSKDQVNALHRLKRALKVKGPVDWALLIHEAAIKIEDGKL